MPVLNVVSAKCQCHPLKCNNYFIAGLIYNESQSPTTIEVDKKEAYEVNMNMPPSTGQTIFIERVAFFQYLCKYT